MRNARPSHRKLKRAVGEFNSNFPVGTPCLLRTDRDKEIQTVVRGEAIVLERHSAVAWFEGIAGCYDIIGRVRYIEEHANAL